ncbi:hypothetical protein VTH06DRAFT_950 [Thermothelomyces fergusii]
MNASTTTTPHTPLETLLLFRGVAKYGLTDDDFVRVSEALRNNGLIKNGPTYDAQRLTPEILRELFLRLLREELRNESENTPGPDGALSPASKKRRLQSPPLLTLADARQHIEKIEAAYTKLYNAYLRHAIHEIRQFEQQFERLQGEIRELEKLSPPGPESEARPQSPIVAPRAPAKQEAVPANGVGPTPGSSPKPPPAPAPISTSQQAPNRGLQPLPPQAGSQHDARAVPSPSPLPQATAEKAAAAAQLAAPVHPESVASPQLGRQEPPKAPLAKPVVVPKPPSGTPHQVLQAPQSVAQFHSAAPSPVHAGTLTAEGLQRPDHGAAFKHLPTANAQLPVQGQLKWEPPYQPNAPPRHVTNTHPQHAPQAFSPQSHFTPSQRSQQQQQAPLPQSSAGPIQGPAGTKPLPPQQALAPPHSAGQLAPPPQSPVVKPPAEAASGPNWQQPVPSNQPPGSGPQAQVRAQAQVQPPAHLQYQGYPVSVQGPAASGHPAPPVQPSPVTPGPQQAPTVVPPAPVPPVPAPPRPSPGLAAPQPPQQPPAFQPPAYTQQPHAQPGAPFPGPVQPEATQRYSSPYQPPRPAAVDRIHPRRPPASTPTPAARFSPAPSAPQTPSSIALPQRLAGGSGTKWVSNSTPSTPKPEFRLGYDDVPSPAYEPTSPILSASAPREVKESQKPEGPAETPKSKPGRSPASQTAQGASPPQPGPRPPSTQPAKSPAKQTAAAEPEPPQVKQDEANTPHLSTEAGDTTADESVSGRPPPTRATKRKREDLTPTPAQTPRASQQQDASSDGPGASTTAAEGPKFVLWTRSFNKVCGSAMEQIIHHRFANMFVAPIREKDAPGYHKVVKQAQDLKTIRAAINHGNRAAAQAAAALPDGDPGTSSVWLPRTEDLVPPKSIINSSQLDRELAHMFSNAVMYNPDPHHGPGPAFLRGEEDDDDDDDAGGPDGSGGGGGGGGSGHSHAQDSGVLGYKVDEFGVVNDARAMFVEVEKLLSELRSAEVRRNVPPGGPHGVGGTGTHTRQASVLAAQGGGVEVEVVAEVVVEVVVARKGRAPGRTMPRSPTGLRKEERMARAPRQAKGSAGR